MPYIYYPSTYNRGRGIRGYGYRGYGALVYGGSFSSMGNVGWDGGNTIVVKPVDPVSAPPPAAATVAKAEQTGQPAQIDNGSGSWWSKLKDTAYNVGSTAMKAAPYALAAYGAYRALGGDNEMFMNAGRKAMDYARTGYNNAKTSYDNTKRFMQAVYNDPERMRRKMKRKGQRFSRSARKSFNNLRDDAYAAKDLISSRREQRRIDDENYRNSWSGKADRLKERWEDFQDDHPTMVKAIDMATDLIPGANYVKGAFNIGKSLYNAWKGKGYYGGRLIKGSPEAKAYMARLRAMRGRGIKGYGIEGRGIIGRGIQGYGIEGRGIQGYGYIGGKRGWLVKGSPEAKRYMRKLRNRRKKRTRGSGIYGYGIEGRGIKGYGIEGRGIQGYGYSGGRLVKGSPEAKAYMARLRAMRGKGIIGKGVRGLGYYGSGKVWNKIKNFGRKAWNNVIKPAVGFAHKTGAISKFAGMIPHPAGQAVAGVAKSLGFGYYGGMWKGVKMSEVLDMLRDAEMRANPDEEYDITWNNGTVTTTTWNKLRKIFRTWRRFTKDKATRSRVSKENANTWRENHGISTERDANGKYTEDIPKRFSYWRHMTPRRWKLFEQKFTRYSQNVFRNWAAKTLSPELYDIFVANQPTKTKSNNMFYLAKLAALQRNRISMEYLDGVARGLYKPKAKRNRTRKVWADIDNNPEYAKLNAYFNYKPGWWKRKRLRWGQREFFNKYYNDHPDLHRGHRKNKIMKGRPRFKRLPPLVEGAAAAPNNSGNRRRNVAPPAAAAAAAAPTHGMTLRNRH